MKDCLKHPNRMIWTFGNHEPLLMYRRIGGRSTGGVPGSAQWLEKWHHWYDSEECAETMEKLGLNILHCRCYKGLGWEEEKKDFPNVVKFARNCRKHGITVLAYIQYSSVYPEIMKREIPDLESWCSMDRKGNLWTYQQSYWRWMPCPNRPGFVDYMDEVIRKIVSSGEFDGVMFDNVLNYPCYCPDCRRKFSERLAKKKISFLDPEFVQFPPEELKGEIMDPVAGEFVRFRHETVGKTFAHFRKLIKSIDPEAIVSANLTVGPRRSNLIFWNMPPMEVVKSLDLPLSQSGNQSLWNGKDCVISQIHEIKLNHALHSRAVPLNDADAGGDSLAGGEYSGPLFESLFGGTIPMDRIVMKPLRGGGLNHARIAARKPILARLKEIALRYEKILELPDYAPLGILYSESAQTLSQKAMDSYLRCEESLIRNHIPYRVIASDGEYIDEKKLEKCSSLLLPNVVCMSDAVVKTILAYKGKLILAGDENASNDEYYREREALPFEHAAAQKVAVTPHDVVNADWKTEIRFLPDDWGKLLKQEIRFNLHPAVHPVIKMREGKVAAILLSAPCAVPAGSVTIPRGMCEEEYFFITLDGNGKPFKAEEKVDLPAFEGMLMLVSGKDLQ